jgi:hypothetical protein
MHNHDVPAFLSILRLILPLLRRHIWHHELILSSGLIDICFSVLSGDLDPDIAYHCFGCIEFGASVSFEISQRLIDLQIFALFTQILIDRRPDHAFEFIPRICTEIISYDPIICRQFTESRLYNSILALLPGATKTHNIPQIIRNAENLIFQLLACIVRCHPSLDNGMIAAIVLRLRMAMQHSHALEGIALTCSAIAQKGPDFCNISIVTGLITSLHLNLTMDNQQIWPVILNALANCAASFRGQTGDAEGFLRVLKPGQLAVVALCAIGRGGPAPRSAIDLLSVLIRLFGLNAAKTLELDRVFGLMLRRAHTLTCEVKHAGLMLALNVIRIGCGDLIEQLFESGLMDVFGEVLEVLHSRAVVKFVMTTMEKLARSRAPTARERDFTVAFFIPFLRQSLEDDDAVCSRARALLAQFTATG